LSGGRLHSTLAEVLEATGIMRGSRASPRREVVVVVIVLIVVGLSEHVEANGSYVSLTLNMTVRPDRYARSSFQIFDIFDD
jgi:hypothetical protein